ncbi:MAG: right-handed parallel beta-helix repeat-containing protein [Deltaproteobacteria bacterium]|nr:right-handed parallel beta-helix repeat-containing protein [Deltaproteobacteria bacterium]
MFKVLSFTSLQALLLLTCSYASAANRDVCANCGYTTVQDAVNNASNGDVIRIAEGTYTENIQLNNSGWTLRFEGGYNDTFSARNSESILQGYLYAGALNSGTLEIDGLTIRNSASQGVVSTSGSTNVSITNCKIHDNADYGIFMHSVANVVISNNQIYSNGGYGGIRVQRNSGVGTSTITENTVYSHSCSSCVGIDVFYAGTGDNISNNIVYSNRTGISITASSASAAPVLTGNQVFSNSYIGISLWSGTVTLLQNLLYRNGPWGVQYYGSGNSTVKNNVFASNALYGLHFVAGSGAPIIRNNIFHKNSYGIYFSGNTSGYGSTSLYPSDFSYNAFFQNSAVHYSIVQSLNSEVPGSYGDINQMDWSSANMFIDPRFVDEDNDDYRLTASSFLIDEGAPDDIYPAEPTPNGGRINIGHLGNTANANTTGAAPNLSNVTASQAGDTVTISFDATASSHSLWVRFEYFDGSSYQPITASAISGTDYAEGYKSGRLIAGEDRELTWTGVDTLFAGTNRTLRLRITAQHGEASVSEESADFNVSFGPTATPTATFTSTPTASPTPSPSPSATPINSPTSTPIPEASATATSTPTATATPSPSPSSTATPPPTITPTRTPTATPTARPPVAPVLTAKKKVLRLGQILSLPLTIRDDDSSTVNVNGYVKFGTKKRSLGTTPVSLPTTNPHSLTFPGLTLKIGTWQYCVRATDSSSLSSPLRCATLVVQPRKHR